MAASQPKEMEGKGAELFKQAEKRLKKWSMFGGGSAKYEEAGELFEKSGNQFKMVKHYQHAGEAFQRCSDCAHHQKDSYSCAIKLVEAAHCYKKVPDDRAVPCYEMAVDIFTDDGKFSNAAKLMKELGEHHAEQDNYDKAVEAWKKSVDYYQGEEQHTSANSVMLQIAKTYGEELAMHAEATEMYDKIAKSYIKHSSMKFQVKDVLLKAMLCRFAQITQANRDSMGSQCRDALGRYGDLDVNLSGTREQELMDSVITAVENDDPEAVSKASADYNGIKTLDDWQVQILLGLKKALTEDDDAALC